MIILAFDTSLSSASIALLEDEMVIGELFINQNRTHSEKFMAGLDSLLKSLQIDIKEIELFAAAIGPGSFTGIRIGVTTAKTMSYALKRPIVGINTLDTMAYGAGNSGQIVCPMIDARNNQVYTALYEIKDKEQYPKILMDYRGVDIIENLNDIKRKYNKNIIFTGDCTDKYKDDILSIMDGGAIFIPSSLELPKASSVGLLAGIKHKKGYADDSYTLEPFYLRPSQAERLKNPQE